MRYTITNQHINYYIDKGFIEFEEIIEIDLLNDAKNNLNALVDISTPLSIYQTGRDLFRKNKTFEQLAKNHSLTKLVKALTHENKLMLAFDQIYKSANIFSNKDRFEKYFSFQNLTCLVICKLDKNEISYSDNFQVPAKFSNIVFVNPQIEFDLSSLQAKEQYLLLIGYGSNKTIYIHNPNDLNNSFLKRFGYGYGDKLDQAHHPYL
jgi:hypothetical protein